MKNKKFKFSKYPTKITSDDESLTDFQISYRGFSLRYPEEDRPAIWVLKRGDTVVRFLRRRSQSEKLKDEYTADGRIKLEFNIIRISAWGDAKPKSEFASFSSMEEQESVITLFLDAMTVFETNIRTPKKPTGTLAVIGPELQKRLDSGMFIRGGKSKAPIRAKSSNFSDSSINHNSYLIKKLYLRFFIRVSLVLLLPLLAIIIFRLHISMQ